MVRDKDGLAAMYQTSSFTTSYAPVPGADGLITASQTGVDVNLIWTQAANGNGSALPSTYRVYQSYSNNIDSVEETIKNGTPVSAVLTDISSFQVTNVSFSKRLYFNVLITDSTGNQAPYAIAVFDTNPEVFIGYIDNTNRDLYFIQYTEGGWSSPELVDGAADDIYQYRPSIQIDSNGDAHMAYYKTTGADLYYANNISGAMLSSLVASNGNVGLYPSLVFNSEGEPYITAYDSSLRDLMLYIPFGTNWAAVTMYAHPAADTVGQWNSTAIDANGFIHASSYNQTTRDLIYTTNASGSFQTIDIDTAGFVGVYTSIAIDSQGFVHISYQDETNTSLKYATNRSGAFVTEEVDDNGSVGLYSSLVVAKDDTIRIAYYSATSTAVMFADNSSGAWEIIQIDGASSSTGLRGLALSLDNLDRPHLAYQDATGSRLMHSFYDSNSSAWIIEELDSGSGNDVGRLPSIKAR